MNPIVAELERTRETELPDGRRVPLHSGVDAATGMLIRSAVAAVCTNVACEVGLAFGMSTLYLLDAMAAAGNGRLIGMDPAQNDATWQGGGLHNIRRAGFWDRYEFHEKSSQVVLPRLAEDGVRIQVAFLDGWHTFDHTLVDFFYVDRMLDPGGLLLLDDVGYPGIRKACHFIVTNREYEVFGVVPRPTPGGWRNAAKRVLRPLLLPLVRDDRTPGSTAAVVEAAVDAAAVIALRKISDDTRRFDHFISF